MSSLDTVCRVVEVLCDGCKVANGTIDVLEESDSQTRNLGLSACAGKAVVAGINIAAVVAEASGASTGVVAGMRIAELGLRIIEFPISLAKTVADGPVLASSLDVMKFFEKRLISTFSGLMRCSSDIEACVARERLALSDEELAKVRIPIFDSGEAPVIIGYRTPTREECRITLERAMTANTILSPVVLCTKLGLFSSAVRKASTIFHRVFSNHQTEQQILERFGVSELPNVLEQEHDPLDLLRWPCIPEALQNDPVLKRYICPISLSPIRYPVGDPNGVTIYDFPNIVQALRVNPVSPVTRRPLHVEQLIPKPALLALINSRLLAYEEKIKQYLREGGTPAVDGRVAQVALEENPRLAASFSGSSITIQQPARSAEGVQNSQGAAQQTTATSVALSSIQDIGEISRSVVYLRSLADLMKQGKMLEIAPAILRGWRGYFGELFCPISNLPIVNVVAPEMEGSSSVFYDRRALEAWLAEHPNGRPPGWPEQVSTSKIVAPREVQALLARRWNSLADRLCQEADTLEKN